MKENKGLMGMIKRSEEMIPRKDGVLSPKRVFTVSKKETKKILGQPKGEVMSNEYLEEVKDFLGDHL